MGLRAPDGVDFELALDAERRENPVAAHALVARFTAGW